MDTAAILQGIPAGFHYPAAAGQRAGPLEPAASPQRIEAEGLFGPPPYPLHEEP
jgi:hypothetical protein